MDDADVRRVLSLVPHAEHVLLSSAHQIHVDQPKRFIAEVVRFASALEDADRRRKTPAE